ncbi:hypothetical protein [Streptomyces sp. NBC_01483]|uniref:hypothetical protein n=1 Tax=Streptomyces sp. NBC_01483 TaxID=2903883 RepID=UPI002E2EDA77|nr:hypothetical protein [Streptomyces sp. NBC_01483]
MRAYRAELSARVDQPVLSDDPILRHDLQLPDFWWQDLTGALEKVSAVATERVAVRQQYMDRAIPEFVGIPAPAVPCWTTAHGDLHWADVTAPLRLLDWEGWGQAPEGFDAATLYAYSLLQPDVAARVRDVFPVLQPGWPRRRSGRVRHAAPDRGPRRQPQPRRSAPELVRGTPPPLTELPGPARLALAVAECPAVAAPGCGGSRGRRRWKHECHRYLVGHDRLRDGRDPRPAVRGHRRTHRAAP